MAVFQGCHLTLRGLHIESRNSKTNFQVSLSIERIPLMSPDDFLDHFAYCKFLSGRRNDSKRFLDLSWLKFSDFG